MKRNYSYFIIKPDGIRFFKDINSIFMSNFQEVRYFKIDDFESIIKKLYYKHYEEKGDKFANPFDQYLYASRSIFGNEALLAIVADKSEENYDVFRKKVSDIKMIIRQKFENPNVSLISNYENQKKNNYIRIIDEDGTENKHYYTGKNGNYRISKLNIIHCPDNDLQSTINELNILCKENVINENNMLGNINIEELLRFKTLNRI